MKDSTIIAAVIGAVATIIAAFVGSGVFTDPSPPKTESPSFINQESAGTQSPNVKTGNKSPVNFSFSQEQKTKENKGTKTAHKNKNRKKNKPAPQKDSIEIHQESKGKQSPNVITGDNSPVQFDFH